MRIGMVEYSEDCRTFTVHGNDAGLPQYDGIIPAPYKSEAEREAIWNEACASIIAHGFLLLSARPCRNEVCDKKGERTSLRVKYRACRTEEEMREVGEKIKLIAKLGYKIESLKENHVAIIKVTMSMTVQKTGDKSTDRRLMKCPACKVIFEATEDAYRYGCVCPHCNNGIPEKFAKPGGDK